MRDKFHTHYILKIEINVNFYFNNVIGKDKLTLTLFIHHFYSLEGKII